jgi:TonB family protein
MPTCETPCDTSGDTIVLMRTNVSWVHFFPGRGRSLVPLILCAALLLGVASPGYGQQKLPEVQTLAKQLADRLPAKQKGNILVVDLKGPEGKWMPFGAWLADQFSAAFADLGGGVQVIDRARLATMMDAHHLPPENAFDTKAAAMLAKGLGADTVVMGSFGAAENGIGITLDAYSVSDFNFYDSSPRPDRVPGKIPLTEDVAAHLDVPLESLLPKDGIFKAGEGGVTEPQCARCPNPDFSNLAVAKKVDGTVVLDAVITPQGRATQIMILQPLGLGLDERAVDAVKQWKFKPATEADGKSVAVHTKIEVTFRVY